MGWGAEPRPAMAQGAPMTYMPLSLFKNRSSWPGDVESHNIRHALPDLDTLHTSKQTHPARK